MEKVKTRFISRSFLSFGHVCIVLFHFCLQCRITYTILYNILSSTSQPELRTDSNPLLMFFNNTNYNKISWWREYGISLVVLYTKCKETLKMKFRSMMCTTINVAFVNFLRSSVLIRMVLNKEKLNPSIIFMRYLSNCIFDEKHGFESNIN